MLGIDLASGALISECVSRFKGHVNQLLQVLKDEFRVSDWEDIQALLNNIDSFRKYLKSDELSLYFSESHMPLMKRAVTWERRNEAVKVEGLADKTFNEEARGKIEERLNKLDAITNHPWFQQADTLRMPRLTDFFVLQKAERLIGSDGTLSARNYDEKFHILQAPELFLPDFRHFRSKCELRGKPIVTAYLDIDDFKAFNSESSETQVDRNVLPIFMQAVESHVFGHGYAYRFGGDEYVLLLPNVALDRGIPFLAELQESLKVLDYIGTEKKTTVSVGVCHVDADSFLTEREALEKANLAKKFAKDKGKARIAAYKGGLFREEDLQIVHPPDSLRRQST